MGKEFRGTHRENGQAWGGCTTYSGKGGVSCKVEHSVLTSRSIFKKHLSAGTHLDVPYQIGCYFLNNCYWYVVT